MLDNRRPVRWLVASALIVTVMAPIAVYAAGTFVDDDTSIFESDIEWMAANAITLGCNPPANDRYCPDDNVTRGQMAAFMHRLAGSNAVDAGNAQRLNDHGPGYYENMIWATGVVDVDKTLTLNGVAMTDLSITTPWDGYLLINATVSVLDTNDESMTIWWLQVDDTDCYPIADNTHQVDYGYAAVTGTVIRESAALTGAVPVDAGSHTITLCGGGPDGTATSAYDPSITAMFSPLGEVPAP